MTACVKTLRLRVKDKHSSVLTQMAREVNTVFNFCNETSSRAIREKQTFLSGYDLQKYAAGYSSLEEVLIGSGTVEAVCDEYATRRRQFKRARLNWRVSNQASPKRSLGWIPFKARGIRYEAGQVKFAGRWFSLWNNYDLAGRKLRAGAFTQDARGRWYFNVSVEVEVQPTAGTSALGIDLGLKTAATTSDGQCLASRPYRTYEGRLASAQRAGKKRLARTLNAKIRNTRKDAAHKFSTRLVGQSAAIFVGDVSSAKLIKTKMAKSTLDAGWSQLKRMLEYKCQQAGVLFAVVNEGYTSQTCSCCGVIPDSSPKGMGALGIRRWTCSDCGAVHDRDVNAARNIARRGLATLAEGASAKLPTRRSRGEQPTERIAAAGEGERT